MPKPFIQLRTWCLLVVPPHAFGAAAQPAVTLFNPALAPAGATVAITGINFNATPVNNIVLFDVHTFNLIKQSLCEKINP